MICLNCCFSLCVVLEETFSIHHKTNPDLPTSRKELAEHRKSVSAEMTVSWSCGCSWTLHVVLLMLRLPFHLISCCFLTANLMMFFFCVYQTESMREWGNASVTLLQYQGTYQGFYIHMHWVSLTWIDSARQPSAAGICISTPTGLHHASSSQCSRRIAAQKALLNLCWMHLFPYIFSVLNKH